MSYALKFKEAAVRKLLMPGCRGLKPLAKEPGVTPQTLRPWRDRFTTQVPGEPMNRKHRHHWTVEEKFQAIVEMMTLNELEQGEYLHRNGIKSWELALWKEQFLSGMRREPKVDP